MLRYLRLLGRIASEPGGRRRRIAGRAFLVLSVFRSDARALSDYLRRHTGARLAESFERDLLLFSAAEIGERVPELRADGHRLIGIKSALEGVAGSLRLETRRAFHHDLIALDPTTQRAPAEERSGPGNWQTCALPCATPSYFSAKHWEARPSTKAASSTTKRRGGKPANAFGRDVWMFAQIVRAFAAKAEGTPPDDRWAFAQNLHFVREFLSYFRTMGYPLLRSTDYPRFDAFIQAMERLEDTDLVDPARLQRAIDECVAFHSFLVKLFDEISKRDVLEGLHFDRRGAAGALKLYIAD